MEGQHSRLLGHNQLVELSGSVFIVSLMAQYRRETLLNQLLRDVATTSGPLSKRFQKSISYLFWFP